MQGKLNLRKMLNRQKPENDLQDQDKKRRYKGENEVNLNVTALREYLERFMFLQLHFLSKQDYSGPKNVKITECRLI